MIGQVRGARSFSVPNIRPLIVKLMVSLTVSSTLAHFVLVGAVTMFVIKKGDASIFAKAHRRKMEPSPFFFFQSDQITCPIPPYIEDVVRAGQNDPDLGHSAPAVYLRRQAVSLGQKLK